MHHRRAFTLTEMLVLLALAVGVLTLFEVASRGARQHAGVRQNGTQLRAIHTACVTYAQGNGGYYPGLDDRGETIDASVEHRFLMLLSENYFAPDHAVSPSEWDEKAIWGGGPVTTRNFSFAMLQLPAAPDAARRAEWRDTGNATAIVLGDRNTGTAAEPASIHHASGGGWGCAEAQTGWRGSMAYNDGHVAFETTCVLPTQYLSIPNPADHVYQPAGDHDAWLVYRGNPVAP